jgi:hypothetical protein
MNFDGALDRGNTAEESTKLNDRVQMDERL